MHIFKIFLCFQEVFLDVALTDSNKEGRSVWSKLRRQWAGTGSQLLLGESVKIKKISHLKKFKMNVNIFVFR